MSQRQGEDHFNRQNEIGIYSDYSAESWKGVVNSAFKYIKMNLIKFVLRLCYNNYLPLP